MGTEDLYLDELDNDQEPAHQAEQPDHWHGQEQDEPAEQPWPSGEEPEPSAHSMASDALGDLSLDLTLRCGALQLSLGQLRCLAEGVVLEVSGIAPGHATLCHGERVLAEGELVDVDGRLGLQITQMVSKP